MRVPESTIVDITTEFLIKSGYEVRHEVSNSGVSIDIVAVKDGLITAIEAKVSDWKRAIKQCDSHVPVADFIGIAMMWDKFSTVLCDEIKWSGIGFIGVDIQSRKCSWLLNPPLNKYIWKPQQKKFIANMKKIKLSGISGQLKGLK